MGERAGIRAGTKHRWRLGVAALAAGCGSLGLLTACDDRPSNDGSAGAGNAAGVANASGGSGFTAPDEPESADDFFEQAYRALCERMFRCLEIRDDNRSLQFFFGTQAICEAEVKRANVRLASMRDLRARLASGELELNPAAAQACLQELASCGETDSFEKGGCREVFEGKQPEGAACTRDQECAGNAYCEGTPVPCTGKCRLRELPGEACTQSGQCAYRGTPVSCELSADGSEGKCQEFERAPKVGEGAECTRVLGSSEAFTLCQDDLWCAPLTPDDSSGVGRCTGPIEGEGACSHDDDVCLLGYCDVEQAKCRNYAIVREEGAACGDDADLYCDPLLGFKCSDKTLGGTCLKQGNGSAGSTCFAGDFQRGCEPGLYCSRALDAVSGTCVPKLAPGEPCQGPSECASDECNITCQEHYCAL